MSKQRYVIIRGQVFRWEEKEPFEPSGFSVHGALEYDPDADALRCHDCGEWYSSLGCHAEKRHNSSREYRKRHGLSLTSALMPPSLRKARAARLPKLTPEQRTELCARALAASRASLAQRRATGEKMPEKGELRNGRMTCIAQTSARLQALAAELGRVPRSEDAAEDLRNAVRNRFGSWNKGLEAAGLEINKVGKYAGKAALRELLRDFFVLNKRLPRASEYGSGRLPNRGTYLRHYGGMEAAYQDAGLALVAKEFKRAHGLSNMARFGMKPPIPEQREEALMQFDGGAV